MKTLACSGIFIMSIDQAQPRKNKDKINEPIHVCQVFNVSVLIE